MPTYEYECTRCGAVTELFQPITEPARKKLKKTDPKSCTCDAPVQRRIGTGAGLIFKGSGFYSTDYRSEGYKSAAKAEKESTGKKAEDAPAASKKQESTESKAKTEAPAKSDTAPKPAKSKASESA
jgi:putative FmdB family regulatory protein